MTSTDIVLDLDFDALRDKAFNRLKQGDRRFAEAEEMEFCFHIFSTTDALWCVKRDLAVYPVYDALAMWLDKNAGLGSRFPVEVALAAFLFLDTGNGKSDAGQEEKHHKLILKPQEIPVDDPNSKYLFQPSAAKPFLSTPGALDAYQAVKLLECLIFLQIKARQHNGIDYLQVFEPVPGNNGQEGVPLWFIEDDEGGAITALLPSDY